MHVLFGFGPLQFTTLTAESWLVIYAIFLHNDPMTSESKRFFLFSFGKYLDCFSTRMSEKRVETEMGPGSDKVSGRDIPTTG